jgi:hypothetical protein
MIESIYFGRLLFSPREITSQQTLSGRSEENVFVVAPSSQIRLQTDGLGGKIEGAPKPQDLEKFLCL